MRLRILLSSNTTPVPFSYPYQLAQQLHHRLGPDNRWHDSLSLYSVSGLVGGRMRDGALDFPAGACWFISAWEPQLLKLILASLYADPGIVFGMEVEEIALESPPEFEQHTTSPYTFHLISPVLLKNRDPQGHIQHITFREPQSAREALTQNLHRKLEAGGLGPYQTVSSIWFDPGYPNPKTKLIRIKHIDNRCSMCPVIVDAPSEVLRFIWLTGIGNSTGMGFGAVR